MKIKVINPNTTMAMTEGIGEAAREAARAGTEIVAVSPDFGPNRSKATMTSASRRAACSTRCARAAPRASMPMSSPATAIRACRRRAS